MSAVPGRLRILVIDDNAAIHDDFKKILNSAEAGQDLVDAEALLFGRDPRIEVQRSYQIDCALQGQQGLACVERAVSQGQPYSLAFVDMRMPPGWDGLETVEHLWSADPELQVVICSAHSDYNWSDVVQRLGHSDRLLVLKKPFEPIEVQQCANALTLRWQNGRSLQRQVESLEQAVEVRSAGLEAANRQLRHLATHDAVTGLPNRSLLHDRLGQAIAHAEREGLQVAVMRLDLDRFKPITESLGNQAGDQLLNAVAQRLKALVRNIDTVARLDGDGFALLIDAVPSAVAAEELAQRAIDVLQAPFSVAGSDVHLGCCMGLTCYPEDGQSAEKLVANADGALQFARQHGRNQLRRYAPGMNAASRERFGLENDLHNALKLGQFVLHYQPKVDAQTGNVHSAEALLRWHHPQRGVLAPGLFIPIAEETGLINPIGAWAIHEACRQCRSWQRDGLGPLRIAVNVAASQVRQGDLLEVVRSALLQAELEASSLELELTESAVMTNPEESAAILEKLSAMGVMVSVDDFGTGYSSMDYLRRFPIDRLKIDRGFIKDLLVRPDDASIVRAIISLAHGMRMKVVAEGVETAEQLHFLRTLGCDQYQGFLFSQPLPARAFAALVRERMIAAEPGAEDDGARTHSKLAALR